MPPPPKKKLKTSASSSEGHALSLELISHVASYANIETGDALNICLAVGPKDANAIRHFCLRNNLDYLEDRLIRYDDGQLTEDQVGTCVKAWMAVNADWKKHVTDEHIKKYKIVQWWKKSEDDAESDDDDDEGDDSAGDDIIMIETDGLVIFNNPLVAIQFDLVDPLRHLVEEFGIDINAYEWNNYNALERYHLLGEAMFGEDLSCLRYLLTRENLDINVKVAPGETMSQIMHYAFDNDSVSLASFEVMASHSSFDANRPVEWGDDQIFPLQYAIDSIIDNDDDSDLDKMEEKLISLLNKFKAHPFYRTPDFRYPAIAQANVRKDKDPRMDRIYWAMMEALTIDEQWDWMRTPIDAFNHDGNGIFGQHELHHG